MRVTRIGDGNDEYGAKRVRAPLRTAPPASVADAHHAQDTARAAAADARIAAFFGGAYPTYADRAVFGTFQQARATSPFKLLEPDDPVASWRERMLDLYGGFARQSVGYPV
ncbi:MAG TPA: hypothetical protein VGV15_22920 [Terriglobales bacterium]|nr:hypothetical protein [Terriglobales bacterium]